MKDAAQKTPHESAVFLHLYRLFYGGKVRKKRFLKKTVFPSDSRNFRDATGRFYGLVWLEHRGLKKNKETGRRSAPHVGENSGLFRLNGAYVAFSSFVYHSLVALVSKTELLRMIEGAEHSEIALGENEDTCYTVENDEFSEKNRHEEYPVYLPRQDLPGMIKSLISSHNPRF